MIKYDNYTIDDQRIRGQQGKTTCPRCIELGKKNIKDTCLSINKDKKLFNCHKCGWNGYYGEIVTNVEKTYVLPPTKNLTDLTNKHLDFFKTRGIRTETIIRNGIKSAKSDWFAFAYYEGQQIVNIKYRTIEKKFMQAKEAKPTMYKYNDIIHQEKIIICEGEFDALSWEEAGYQFATSVNAGAPNVNDKNVEKKLECVYNCFDVFEKAEEIYLSVDSDANGQRLQKELIKMFTAEKIKIINHGECKDANEVLLKHGPQKLKELFESAKEVKIDGIFECYDYKSEIEEAYKTRQPRGTTTYFSNIDECWTHRPGEVTIWTGYNNEGKSLLLKQLLLIKSKYDNWKHAIFSPEEVPLSEFYTDLIESYIGKSADKDQAQYNNYMNENQLKEGIEFCNKYFYVVYPDDDHSTDELLKRFSYLVRKKNIQTVVFDPYNQIHHKMKLGEREDLYISRFMAKLKKFAVTHMVSVHLVAHQSTPLVQNGENYPTPNIYKIKGGGTFGDKADNVIAVWREFRNTNQKDTSVKFISQKIKKQKLTGTPGEAIIHYNRRTNRYLFNNRSPFNADEIEVIKQEVIKHDEGIEPATFYEKEPVFTESDIPF